VLLNSRIYSGCTGQENKEKLEPPGGVIPPTGIIMKDDNEMEENLASIIKDETHYIVCECAEFEKKKELHDNMNEEEKAELWRRDHPVLARKTERTIHKQLKAIKEYTPEKERKDNFRNYERLLRNGGIRR
jgi:hypothetical protein